MPKDVLSVAQINEYIRASMDSDPLLSAVAIRGEISNYKVYPSGHHYFSLKDDTSAIRCVMFKGNAFGLKFRPDNGMKIIAMGRISVYPRDGAYQLYCTAMVPDGVGDLHAAFEQLKAKLSAQGLFDLAHKKPLPKYPETIGIITSEAGAAVHDMLRILAKRYPLTKVLLFPVRVQGVEAPQEIVQAIKYANHHKLADLLIVGRGGGSIEDLWAFNDEAVAHAIYDSVIPVISAVGHEPDVTISDYVADLRAATPSNAAELAVPDQQSLNQMLDAIQDSMAKSLLRQLSAARQQVNALASSSALQGPTRYIEIRRNALALLAEKLYNGQFQLSNNRKQRFVYLTGKLDAMSPLKVLSRGYAVVQGKEKEVISSIQQIEIGRNVDVILKDGSFHAKILDSKETNV